MQRSEWFFGQHFRTGASDKILEQVLRAQISYKISYYIDHFLGFIVTKSQFFMFQEPSDGASVNFSSFHSNPKSLKLDTDSTYLMIFMIVENHWKQTNINKIVLHAKS